MVIGLGCAAALLWQQSLSAQPSPSSNVASMRVEGRLIKIQGRYYVIEDSQGKEIYLMVSQDTELSGTFKVGDRIAIWTSPIEHAIAIRATALDQEPETISAATRTISGQLIAIEGKYYVMLDREGKEIRLLVNQDTELAGEFAPGDQIEVFTSPVEHAVFIKAAP
ncbi:hypothetical protein [Petrachloros mirabilis]